MLIIDGATSSVLINSLEVEMSFVLKPLLIKIFIADSILLARRIESAIKIFISKGLRTKDISTSKEFIKTEEVAPSIINILKDEHE